MKINKLTKIIIVIVVFLSISITITASNLGYINKIISNKSPKPEKALVEKEVEPVGISKDDQSNQQVPDEPIAESPVAKDPLVEGTPNVENPLLLEDTNTTASKEPSTTNNPIDKENKPSNSKDKQSNTANNKPVNNSNNNSNNTNKPNTSNNSNNNNGNGNGNDNNNDKKANDKKNDKSIVPSKNISKDEAIEIGLNKIGPKSKLIDLESNLDENPPKYVLEVENNESK